MKPRRLSSEPGMYVSSDGALSLHVPSGALAADFRPAEPATQTEESEMPYVVMVDDNFHYRDENERYRHGEFADAEVAIEHCRQIVDEYLESALEPGMSAEKLWKSYMSFGEDPWIQSVDVTPVGFSAWDYARVRCAELCKAVD